MKSFLIIAIVLLLILVSSIFAGDDNYNYEGGPASWPKSNCGGSNQSPIDFNTKTDSLSAQLPNFFNTYNINNFAVTNKGHTIEITDLSFRNTITFDSMIYYLQQIHFHTPSEHHIDGKYYDAEAHFVFKNQSKTSVVGVLFSVNAGGFSRFLDPIQYLFPPKGATWTFAGERVNTTLDFFSVVSFIAQTPYWAYRYSGSLTTPPCDEGVTWWVASRVMPISVHQLNELRNHIGYNSRPTQPRNGRKVPPTPS